MLFRSSLKGDDGSLAILVWAVRDPDSAPLAKVQVIKGWLENGERHEVVHDVACGAASMDAALGKCESNPAAVSLNDCSWDNSVGASELRTLWVDPDYDSALDAFYYVRVVQNPTCRWSTYDSLRLGRKPPPDLPATVSEMAWGAPIWVEAE